MGMFFYVDLVFSWDLYWDMDSWVGWDRMVLG